MLSYRDSSMMQNNLNFNISNNSIYLGEMFSTFCFSSFLVTQF